MTIGEWQRQSVEALRNNDCPDPAIDTSWILEDTLGMTRTVLRFAQSDELSEKMRGALDECLERRLRGEPVQYILHRADFMGLTFYVDSGVLIPRQDTETVTEHAIAKLMGMEHPKVLDLCAGSGAIGLSVKSLVPHADVTLSDISPDAIEVILKNARALELDVAVRHGDLFHAVGNEKFDMIISNPPYIPSADIPALQREVRHEPLIALDGGRDGLDFYRTIAEEAPEHLTENGSLYAEVGIGQAQDVLRIFRQNIPAADSGIVKDICGVERVVWIEGRG